MKSAILDCGKTLILTLMVASMALTLAGCNGGVTSGNPATSNPPPAPPLADSAAPTAPTSLAANPVSATQINLSWTASTDNIGVTGYRIYRGGVQIATVNATSYTNSGLAPATPYRYTVAAVDAAGNVSAQTGAVSATTPAASSSSFPVAFDAGITYSRDLFVNANAQPGGNGSQATPYQTIGGALAQATPGTRIRIAAGTYGPVGSFSNLQGNAQAPIALIGEGAVVIDVSGADQALHLSDPRYLVIQGVTVQNSNLNGFNIDDGGSYSTPADHVVLRNVTFRNIGSGGNNDCLKMSGVDNFYIEGSSFSGCNAGEAIDMVGCHNGVITGNQFFDTPGNGVQTKGGSADILIHGNRFTNVAQRSINAGGSTGAAYYRPSNTTHEGARIQMIANIFERPGDTAVAFVGCDTCVFANNTIIEPGRYMARILEENTTLTSGAAGYFINNIIVFNTASLSSYVNVGSSTQPATYTFGWNLWYALDNAAFAGPVYNSGVPAEINGIIQRDPLLDANRRPRAGSPAIGAGRDVPRGLAGDFNRNAYTSPPTVGAFAGP